MPSRISGIPPPFRGVSELRIEASESTGGSYQPPASPAKTFRLTPVPWSPARRGRLVRESDGSIALWTRVLRWNRRRAVVLLGYSPLLLPERNHAASRPEGADSAVALLEVQPEGVLLSPVSGADCLFVDGDPAPALVRGSAIVDFKPALGPVTSWFLEVEPGHTLTTDELGPLWPAWRCGAFTYSTDERGRWTGTLRGGDHSLGLDSLAWLRRVLSSPLADRFDRLSVEPSRIDEASSWSDFVEAHHVLARAAPFSIQVEARSRPPLRLKPERPAVTPHAQFLDAGWHVVPLAWEHGVWVLRAGGDEWRWRPDGDQLVAVGSGPEQVTPFFSVCRNTDGHWTHSLSNFRLLPGPSAFLSNRRRLPAGPLTPTLVSVFADQLESEGDCAGRLLIALAQGGAEATHARECLHHPYAVDRELKPGPVFQGEQCCGFVIRATVAMWSRFHADLPVLLAHPMLQRLERLDLVDRTDGDGRPVVSETTDEASMAVTVRGSAHADKVFLRGSPLRAPG